MLLNWRRLTGATFSVHDFTAQNTEQFYIQVLDSKDVKKQAVNLIMEELFRDNPIFSALGLVSDPVTVDSVNNWIMMYLDQNITHGCFSQREGILVAVDVLYVRNRYDGPIPLEQIQDTGKAFRNWINYMKKIENNIWLLGAQRRTLNYLTSVGVFTTPAYRDLDIQKYMVKIRKSVATALRIKVIASAFIGGKMQDAATANKYKVIREFNREMMMELRLSQEEDVEVSSIIIMGIENRFKTPSVAEIRKPTR